MTDPSDISRKSSNLPLQAMELLLFIDERPGSQEYVRQIQLYLEPFAKDGIFELQVIGIHEQPNLVEHFRLVATPALVKVKPEPRQTLAGSNLVSQLKKCFPRWQKELSNIETDKILENDIIEVAQSQSDSLVYSTEVMKLSDEVFRLKQEREELLRQLEFKEQVLAMLAHDLRSPLTAASIAVETIELTQEQPETERTLQLQNQLHQQIRKQFRLMDRMITDILDAARAMSAQLQVQYSQVFLQDICPEIVQQFSERFEEKHQIFNYDIPQDLPSVFIDAELIRQVIVNLLENAAKYTPAGGEITFSIIHRTSQKVQVTISDTGPGIPEEKQHRIFEGHFRLQRDRNQEGYGLGLALCRKIISAHYGQIWVESIPDQGSDFNFTLPVYR